MGQHQIIEKLKTHLGAHTQPTEECYVLYLMAEIRKYLLQEKPLDAKYSVLQFYGNWCVHRQIDRNGSFIKQITPDIEKGIQHYISGQGLITKGDKLARFLTLELLKDALKTFLQEKGISAAITNGDNWEAFRARLFGILSEQRFEEPEHKRFRIDYDRQGNGDVVIEFEVKPAQTETLPFSQKDIA
jgi:hypothetical protein